MDVFLTYLEAQERVVVTWFDEAADIPIPEEGVKGTGEFASPAGAAAGKSSNNKPKRG